MIHRITVLTLFAALAGCGGSPAAQQQRTVAEEALLACDSEVADYADVAPAADHSLNVRLASGGALMYLGSPDARVIEDAFNAFQPTLVYHEGSRSVARDIAGQRGVPAQSIEPGLREQVAFLRQSHEAEQVKLFFVLREIARLSAVEQLPLGDLLEATAQALVRANDLPELGGVVRDLSELEASYVRYFGTEHHWSEIPASWFDPTHAGQGGFVGEMSASLSHFRDLYAYRTLATAAIEGERVFAVVADERTSAQRPALVCALEGK